MTTLQRLYYTRDDIYLSVYEKMGNSKSTVTPTVSPHSVVDALRSFCK